MRSVQGFERLTIAVPLEVMSDMEDIKNEMKINKSELVRRAIEEFIKNYKRKKLEKIALMMKDEYEKNKELTTFTSLDGEGFID
ncbi:MAG TPA: ribbon-helix-helix domain-containing protein [Thermodesulfobacteriota bacterium]|nr:ribbon-helix-helix domain-containing protein [Thermodesulfobacteriota bacterium]